ncbi:MAG: hypothetical protein EPN98_21365 [Phenylobacterium sp.]|uniref:hypothetical protein n=1 Tax=Phenylobacterium sp. TaxID=1871053 RepID=UPI00120B83B4|nr:hypothetical protein [Phenylobacterium sp.]TAL28994.1 MAG: hypothetical protein EPN98_21365 [Phenylobacterium sp.]
MTLAAMEAAPPPRIHLRVLRDEDLVPRLPAASPDDYEKCEVCGALRPSPLYRLVFRSKKGKQQGDPHLVCDYCFTPGPSPPEMDQLLFWIGGFGWVAVGDVVPAFVRGEDGPPARNVRSVLHIRPLQLDFDSASKQLRTKVKSIGNAKLKRREHRAAAQDEIELKRVRRRRPKTYEDCVREIRGPCPWVLCRHHLYLDVDEKTGALKLNFPGLEVHELAETCSLRQIRSRSDDGGLTGKPMKLEEIGKLMNITLERTRQIVEAGVEHMEEAKERLGDIGTDEDDERQIIEDTEEDGTD